MRGTADSEERDCVGGMRAGMRDKAWRGGEETGGESIRVKWPVGDKRESGHIGRWRSDSGERERIGRRRVGEGEMKCGEKETGGEREGIRDK